MEDAKYEKRFKLRRHYQSASYLSPRHAESSKYRKQISFPGFPCLPLAIIFTSHPLHFPILRKAGSIDLSTVSLHLL
ncbi:MAG: hypothetical protein EBS53_05965 [Bacteroidetes bacterium]|nr:hypothetical protein [Bacteroidota bacterium]